MALRGLHSDQALAQVGAQAAEIAFVELLFIQSGTRSRLWRSVYF